LLVPAFVRPICAASVARPKPPGCPQRYNFTLEMIVQAGRKRIPSPGHRLERTPRKTIAPDLARGSLRRALGCDYSAYLHHL
jgi:hypothetical protein